MFEILAGSPCWDPLWLAWHQPNPAPPQTLPGWREEAPHRYSLEGPKLQVSEVLSQLLCLQVVEKQGYFALFAHAGAVHGGWGARATGAQAGGKKGQGIGRAQGGGGWDVKEDFRVRVGRGRADSQVGVISQAPLGQVALLFHSGPEATYNLF